MATCFDLIRPSLCQHSKVCGTISAYHLHSIQIVENLSEEPMSPTSPSATKKGPAFISETLVISYDSTCCLHAERYMRRFKYSGIFCRLDWLAVIEFASVCLLDLEKGGITILRNVGYQSVRRNIPGGTNHDRYYCKNIKSSKTQ